MPMNKYRKYHHELIIIEKNFNCIRSYLVYVKCFGEESHFLSFGPDTENNEKLLYVYFIRIK
eukprot:UN17245